MTIQTELTPVEAAATVTAWTGTRRHHFDRKVLFAGHADADGFWIRRYSGMNYIPPTARGRSRQAAEQIPGATVYDVQLTGAMRLVYFGLAGLMVAFAIWSYFTTSVFGSRSLSGAAIAMAIPSCYLILDRIEGTRILADAEQLLKGKPPKGKGDESAQPRQPIA